MQDWHLRNNHRNESPVSATVLVQHVTAQSVSGPVLEAFGILVQLNSVVRHSTSCHGSCCRATAALGRVGLCEL